MSARIIKREDNVLRNKKTTGIGTGGQVGNRSIKEEIKMEKSRTLAVARAYWSF